MIIAAHRFDVRLGLCVFFFSHIVDVEITHRWTSNIIISPTVVDQPPDEKPVKF